MEDRRFLGPEDPLPSSPRRVLVTGASGSGKSTVARAVAARLGLPYTEIDSLYHGPDWVPRPAFVADVTTLVAQPAWATEWQYSTVRGLLADRADLLIWLDLPRWLILIQVTIRTLRRRFRREPLWNGNLEPPLWTILRNADHIIRWSWRSHARVQPRVVTLSHSHPQLPVVRLRTRRDISRWLNALPWSTNNLGR